MFHIFGIFAPLGALAAVALDRRRSDCARTLFWIGAAVDRRSCNVGLVYLTSTRRALQRDAVGMLWIALDGRRAAGRLLLRSVLGRRDGRHARHRVHRARPRAVDRDRDGGHLHRRPRRHRDADHHRLDQRRRRAAERRRGAGSARHRRGARRRRSWSRATRSVAGRAARSATALAELQSAMRDHRRSRASARRGRRRRRAPEARQRRPLDRPEARRSYRLGVVLGRGAMGEVYEALRPDGSAGRAQAAQRALDGLERDRRALSSRDGRRRAARVTAHRARCSSCRRPTRRCRTSRWSGCTASISRRGCATRTRTACRPTSSSSCSIRSRAGSRSRGSRASCIAISSRTTCFSTTARLEDPRLRRLEGARQRGHADRRGHRRHAAVHGAGAGIGRAGHAPRRRLRARRDRVSLPDRPLAVQGQGSRRARLPGRAHAAAAAERARAACRRRSRTCSRSRWPRIRAGGFRRRCRSRRRSSPRAVAAQSRSRFPTTPGSERIRPPTSGLRFRQNP